MRSLIQKGGRSVEEFTGHSSKGNIVEALQEATQDARRTLNAPSVRWTLVQVGGVATDKGNEVIVTIKANIHSA